MSVSQLAAKRIAFVAEWGWVKMKQQPRTVSNLQNIGRSVIDFVTARTFPKQETKLMTYNKTIIATNVSLKVTLAH